MFEIKLSAVVLLMSVALNGAVAGACNTNQNQAAQNANRVKNKQPPATQTTPEPTKEAEETVNGNLQVIAEGGYGKVTDAFIMIARDAETYGALREITGQLPDMDEKFWRSNAVIAAFLGQRRTGGYTVEISRAADGALLRISEKSPPSGSMTTQVITAPFKIVAVPVMYGTDLAIEWSNPWKNLSRPYRVGSGQFKMSGGIAGRAEEFQLAGDVNIMRYGRLATFSFDLKNADGGKPRALKSVATGIVKDGGSMAINYLDAGTLVDQPRSPLRADGTFTKNEDSLTLNFASLPSQVADGFSGQGKIEAAATAPAPQKKKTVVID